MFTLSNSYLKLPPLFYERVNPTPVSTPSLIALNEPLAVELGLSIESCKTPEAVEIFAGNSLPSGATPLALAYSGHQFGHFVPVLGDGRAVLLGELTTCAGTHVDLQLKGAGKTPFSRRGDGRAALGPMMREYIIGEALHALGIPATRTLAVVATGETVMRERPLPGGIQTRIARSHIRVGTFEYAAQHGDRTTLQALADYVIDRHYPFLKDSTNENSPDRYMQLAQSIFDRQAALVAQWMHIGFIHGVMNTDNVSVSGESIDFGPCAFMNRYDPSTVFSSIDQYGRYAYGSQPNIIQWNLARLAESLLPLFDENQERALPRAQELVESFPDTFSRQWHIGMREKLGLVTVEPSDSDLMKELLATMYNEKLDYTATFRALAEDPECPLPPSLDTWHTTWRSRVDSNRNSRTYEQTLTSMQAINPAILARNHLVEEVIKEGVANDNFSPMIRLVDALRSPFTPHPQYSIPPSQEDSSYRTFCGT